MVWLRKRDQRQKTVTELSRPACLKAHWEVHPGSSPAGLVTQTQIISTKMDKLLSHKAEHVNMVDIIVYIQLNPNLKAHNS